MRGRKRGCPTNIRDWWVEVYDDAAADWVRVAGCESLEIDLDSDARDNSLPGDLWEENAVTKRKMTWRISGKVVCDETTGAKDPGQKTLTDAAYFGGCAADLDIRFADPYGHGMSAVCVVRKVNKSADTGGSSIDWDMDIVGEPEPTPFIPVSAISANAGTINMTLGDSPRLVTVSVSPANASNRRWRLVNGNRLIVSVGEVSGNTFLIAPLRVGSSTIRLTSVNGGKTCTINVNVTRAKQPYEVGVLGTGRLGYMVLGKATL